MGSDEDRENQSRSYFQAGERRIRATPPVLPVGVLDLWPLSHVDRDIDQRPPFVIYLKARVHDLYGNVHAAKEAYAAYLKLTGTQPHIREAAAIFLERLPGEAD